MVACRPVRNSKVIRPACRSSSRARLIDVVVRPLLRVIKALGIARDSLHCALFAICIKARQRPMALADMGCVSIQLSKAFSSLM